MENGVRCLADVLEIEDSDALALGFKLVERKVICE